MWIPSKIQRHNPNTYKIIMKLHLNIPEGLPINNVIEPTRCIESPWICEHPFFQCACILQARYTQYTWQTENRGKQQAWVSKQGNAQVQSEFYPYIVINKCGTLYTTSIHAWHFFNCLSNYYFGVWLLDLDLTLQHCLKAQMWMLIFNSHSWWFKHQTCNFVYSCSIPPKRRMRKRTAEDILFFSCFHTFSCKSAIDGWHGMQFICTMNYQCDRWNRYCVLPEKWSE